MNDYERTRKYASSGTFVDLCNRCFSEVSDDIPDIEGDDIDHTSQEEIDETEIYNPNLGLDVFGSYGSGEPDDES